jgi:hypothetical protein
MRSLLLGILIFISTGLVFAQSNNRQVDFKNFTFPLSGPLLGHGELKWLGDPRDGYSKLKPIHLSHGKDSTGFTLESVAYADLTGDGKEDAIVDLLYQTGGTQNTDYVYIYSVDSGKPRLLAYCHTGDRADSGLYAVYGKRGILVFELFDPQKREGDCCSAGFVRTRYRWQNGRFVRFGAPEFGPVKIIEHADK